MVALIEPLSLQERPGPEIKLPACPLRFVRQVQLRNGATLILRPIQPEDEWLWHRLLQRTSQQSLWQRFGYLFKESTHEMAARYCYTDYTRTIAIVAEATVGGEKRLVAVGRLEADPVHYSAEFAILVEDDWQGKGLGLLLARFCIEVARMWGLQRIIAQTTADNRRMQAIFRRLAFQISCTAYAKELICTKLLSVEGSSLRCSNPH